MSGLRIVAESRAGPLSPLPRLFPAKHRHPNLQPGETIHHLNAINSLNPNPRRPTSTVDSARSTQATLNTPASFQDGCQRPSRHPGREHSICTVQACITRYATYLERLIAVSNIMLGESAVGKVCLFREQG
jgi:hypothetical protein